MVLEGKYWREISLGEGMTPIIEFNEDVILKWIISCLLCHLKTEVQQY